MIVVAAITLASGTGAGAQPPGMQLWATLYHGKASGSQDLATALAVSPDGDTVFVTGESGPYPFTPDYATAAYDSSTGVKRWARRYDGPGDDFDEPAAIAVTHDGSTVFVTGYSDGSTSGRDYATVAYSASQGKRVWVSRYNGPANGFDEAAALTVSSDDATVFVTGQSIGPAGHYDYATVAYDASTGATLWAKRHSFGGATAIGVSPDGSMVFVTGGSVAPNDAHDYTTLAYRADTGDQLWLSRYQGPSNYSDASSIGVNPDGSAVYVTGSSLAKHGSTTDFATVAYGTAHGRQLWVTRYNGPANSFDHATALGVSPDGSSVFVTGSSQAPNTITDFATLAYRAATGARLWLRRYDAARRSDGASDLGVSPDGATVFVTGSSYGSTGRSDYATVAYPVAGGSRLWVNRYDGPAGKDDFPTALGVGRNGGVFVTGAVGATTSLWDYGTVAYSG